MAFRLLVVRELLLRLEIPVCAITAAREPRGRIPGRLRGMAVHLRPREQGAVEGGCGNEDTYAARCSGECGKWSKRRPESARIRRRKRDLGGQQFQRGFGFWFG